MADGQLADDMVHVWRLARDPKIDDRVVAIVCTAFLEDALEEAISVRLPGLTDELRRNIFNPRGALGTLGAKIDLAEAVRAVASSAAFDLRTLAKIRNKFAHQVRSSSFEDDSVRDLIRNLRDGSRIKESMQSLGGMGLMMSEGPPSGDTLRDQYVEAATSLASSVFNCARDAGFGLMTVV